MTKLNDPPQTTSIKRLECIDKCKCCLSKVFITNSPSIAL